MKISGGELSWVKSGPGRDRGLQWSARKDERDDFTSSQEERLVYTENVGGSSPSPPTMMSFEPLS